jgi:gliding motility-associated-like protein
MKRIYLLIALIGVSYIGLAQPCMDAWRFRIPITIDNTQNSNPLVDYQVMFTIATDSLISNGDMKADASDLRFTNSAGVLLPFWIVNNTLQTDTTQIWVNVDNIPPGSTIDIYMFYGNTLANSVMDGDATFLHYDNFDGTALDFGKWTYCGGAAGGTIPVVAGGEVTFASSSGQYSHMIKSLQNFGDTITTEMKVNSFNTGPVILGQMAPSGNGYAMVLQEQGSVDNMRLNSLDPYTGSSDSCLTLVNQTPVQSVTTGSVQGLWSFTWRKPNHQLFAWPNGTQQRNSYIDSSYFHDLKNIVLGSFYNTSSFSVDYIYTRKYSSIPPSYSIGLRTDLVDYVNASTNAPICVGDSLKLFAPPFSGAVYSWIGPNGYNSSDRNPVIAVSDFTHVGEYILTVSAPTGCSVVSDSVVVSLDSIPVAGTLSSDTTVCYGAGIGVLNLENTTGYVVYWQSSNTFNGPWNTITDTNFQLAYDKLLASQHYRVVVENGTCGRDTSNIVSITVDSLSHGGSIQGTNAEVCKGFNTGYLTAIDYVGDIVMWQSSIDSGNTWTPISTTSNEIQYTNLTDSTWYRMMVKNGVCDTAYSEIAKVFVHPIPLVNFTADSVCLGFPTGFTSLSSIQYGTIDNFYWNYDDGASASIKNPIHNFSNYGTYNVQLKIVSNMGCIDSITQPVVVHPKPHAHFSFIDVCDTSKAQFTNLSTIPTGNIEYNIWSYDSNLSGDTALNGGHTYATYGNYDVSLRVVSDYGCMDSLQQTIRVLQRAIVDFIPDSVCLEENIAFINTSQSFQDSTTYSWNFGNGQVSQDKNPIYTYPNHGTYQVVLQASTFGKCIDTKVDTVVIYPLPQASFTFSNECQYDTVSFLNTSTIYSGSFSSLWHFGDSTTSTMDTVNHYYTSPGNYFVSLFLESDFGCVDDTTLMTDVYTIPTANFVVGNVCRDTLTPLNNLSSVASGSYSSVWSFGNGDSAWVKDPLYTFPQDGTFDIRLVVESNNGCIDSITKPVVIHPIPKTYFVADSICLGIHTSFTNLTTINKGYINSYLWNFDDQLLSIDTNPTHLYAHDGSYHVKLRAVSDKGCQKDTLIPIVVYPVPELDFRYDNACVFAEIQFDNYSTINTGFQTYFWQFGDDSTSQLQSPKHTYQRHGFFPVQLSATSNHGCKDSLTQIIEVYPLPLVDAGIDTSVSYGFYVDLLGIAPTAVSVSWTPSLTVVNNNKLVTEARPLENTIFNLEVTDEHGCISSDDVYITVIKDYKLLVSNVVTPNGDGKNDTWKIYNASSFDDIHIKIYNTWGQEVYSADLYKEEWDGVLNLDQLTEGVYYYTITFDGSDRIYKGAVTILK